MTSLSPIRMESLPYLTNLQERRQAYFMYLLVAKSPPCAPDSHSLQSNRITYSGCIILVWQEKRHLNTSHVHEYFCWRCHPRAVPIARQQILKSLVCTVVKHTMRYALVACNNHDNDRWITWIMHPRWQTMGLLLLTEVCMVYNHWKYPNCCFYKIAYPFHNWYVSCLKTICTKISYCYSLKWHNKCKSKTGGEV